MKINDSKLTATLGFILAIALLFLSIFALGRTTGDIVKSITYGLLVVNAVLWSFQLRKTWKK